ncbi:hypothetical protein [Paenibacillus pini]|uniref:Lipoprotein n=1 Tax=Paenibacillus pini JCM 16418 TaxID=1236976 RepID=W7Y944_9BACL|nr:hypothetical protein [Paenibacillus pini]GAF07505.1 hypothetical protein JCM16418_1523 [Paenibacillus pini JCM 16418]
MLKLKYFRFCGAILMMFLLSGCTFLIYPVSLMRAPQLTAEKEDLKTIIHSQLPEGATIVRSRDEQDTNQIHFEDLDGDKINEAIVFYDTSSEQPANIQGMIFKNVKNTWVKQVTFTGEGTRLESLQFEDLTNNGIKNIIAGYSRRDDNDVLQGLVVYNYTGSSVEKILELPYTKFIIDDLNGDHIKDLSVLQLVKNEYAYMTTYQYKDSFIELDKIEMEPFVSGYYNIVAGKVLKDQEGIIVDTLIGEKSSKSQVIIMKDDKLVVALDSKKTYKEWPIASQDVDNDGILEIGSVEPPKGWSFYKTTDIPLLTIYSQWDGKDDLIFKAQEYRDYINRFHLGFFPKSWYGNLTIDTKSVIDEYLRFILLDNGKDTGKTVAEIKFFTLSQWEKQHEDWKYLVRKNEKVIGYKTYGDWEVNANNKRLNNEVPPIERKEKTGE